MAPLRCLIVNADDFGQSRGVNAGVIDAHDRGIVTSASLMVRWPAAIEAVEMQRTRPSLSLGVHLDLGEWAYRDGEWVPRYEVVRLDAVEEVADEIERQVARFVELVGAPPTHIDSHQHVHLRPPVREAALAVAERIGAPLRHFTPDVRYCGEFYGQDTEGKPLHHMIEPAALKRILYGIPPGITELACHPGHYGDVESTYRVERAIEVRTLCDQSLRKLLQSEGIVLSSFAGTALPRS